MKQDVTFELRSDHITLDALLKATGVAMSGGAAKQMILEGQVLVDGATENRRGRKIRAGQIVQIDGLHINIRAAQSAQSDPSVERAP